MTPNKPRELIERAYCMADPLEKLTDDAIIAHIPEGSRVIDLGCGDGRLLAKLRGQHGASIQGIELNRRSIIGALRHGVPVVHSDLDKGLAGFPDQAFDFAVLSQTLQQVRHPRLILQEMLRVAKRSLVVVPNYGYWRARLDHFVWGRAPVTRALPYEWYDTPNLHFMSMLDFRELVGVVGGRIVKEAPMIHGKIVDRAYFANWRAESALYVLEKVVHK
jgi:methionine biosynthesis protein MetW